MSESAFVAAIRPNAYGSSTIGVKKSAVCTSASSGVNCTTPASSARSIPTSTRGSVGRGNPATIGRRSAAESLHPQPAPWLSEVRGTAIRSYDGSPVASRREYTDAEVDAAVQALTDPDRLAQAQRVVEASAPALQRILNQALQEENWFDTAHQQQVLQAAGKADIEERLHAVRLLLAEETRVAMLIGVAVGYQLAHELIDHDGTRDVAANVRRLGHSAFHLSGGGADVLIDPFLTGNPKAAATADEVPADVILVSHAHGDHCDRRRSARGRDPGLPRARRPRRGHGGDRQAHGRHG